MRKVYVDLKVRLVLQVEEGIEIANVLDELDYNFSDQTGMADIVDMEIKDYDILDSK
jgi:hypothetical protein